MTTQAEIKKLKAEVKRLRCKQKKFKEAQKMKQEALKIKSEIKKLKRNPKNKLILSNLKYGGKTAIKSGKQLWKGLDKAVGRTRF